MTDRTTGMTAPLGVGDIVGQAFSLLFKRFGVFFILAFVPAIISTGMQIAFLGTDYLFGAVSDDPEAVFAAMQNATSPLGIFLTYVLPLVLYGLSTALIVCAAYDAKLGKPARLGLYFNIAAMRAVPIVLVSLVVGILSGVAALALLLPGLYVYGMFSVAVVAVVLESMWFGALGRSMQLTKGYRWPVIGSIVLLFIALILIQLATGFLALGLANVSTILGILVFTAVNAVGGAVLSIGLVLIYARLRELKEGVGVDTLAQVFS